VATGKHSRLRVQFSKKDRMRFLSHAEFSRMLMVSARRAGLPVRYGGKHRSRMKISLSPPIPIGFTSDCELVDYELTGYVPSPEATARLNHALPDGIRAVRSKVLPIEARPVGKIIDTAAYNVTVPAGDGERGKWIEAAEDFLGRDVVEFERVQPRRTRVLDLRPGVQAIEVGGSTAEPAEIRMVLDDGISGTVKPMEVLIVMADSAGIPEDRLDEARFHREGLFARRETRLVSPMELGRRSPGTGRGPEGGL
jgi:radical SAM-linked protein